MGELYVLGHRRPKVDSRLDGTEFAAGIISKEALEMRLRERQRVVEDLLLDKNGKCARRRSAME